ncbi:MAG TPA: hypothetical protein VMY40_05700 [Anaerolineae bacterium]|nr:hypothetical protein [Anaerolineae bacterium]
MAERGAPRTQYERTYVLLPPSAGAAWVEAVVEATWDEHRYTIGGSADDAGIGDLDVRRVFAVNPSRWQGDLRAFFEEHYPGIQYVPLEATTPDELRQKLSDDPPPLPGVRVGFNDPGNQGAGQWLAANAPRSFLCVPVFLGNHAQAFDFSAVAAAGVQVIVNLRYGWSVDCGGQGTLPTPGQEAEFVQACIQTIRQSVGIWGWTVGNEYNNRREWPNGVGLAPEYVADVYNAIWGTVPARIAPGAVDPFNVSLCDVQEYWRRLWSSIHGADFVDLHGYIRYPDASQCWSEARFIDEPLTWQYLNFFGCCETLLERLPEKYRQLPAVVSEFNHLWQDDGQHGWVNDARAGDVVRAAHQRLKEWNAAGQDNPVIGLAIYRWRGDDWAVDGNASVLNAIKEVASV